MTKIDILLPYWGEFSLLKETVDSVLAQTSGDWRLIILDDHYPSTEAYNYYKNFSDQRVQYIRHKKNLGITKNFNFALEKASSDFCSIIGCDDKLLPNYVELALKNIGTADFYQPSVEVIDAEGNIYLPLVDRVKRLLSPRKPGLYKGEKLAASLCRGNWLYFPSIVWRTKTVKKYRFDPHYKIAEDLDLEFAMILDGAELYVDDATTFQYRRFAESLSSREKERGGVRFYEEDRVYDIYTPKFAKIGWKKATLAAKARITSRLHRLLS